MPSPEKPATTARRVERWLETALFGGRWLLAPVYLGLLLVLPLLMWVFAAEVIRQAPRLLSLDVSAEDAVLLALSLVDLSLVGNLIIIVILSGYETVVSRISIAVGDDRPGWLGKVDFSGLKLKLMGSIIAISAISLLKTFMSLGDKPVAQQTLVWQVIIHLTFLASGVFLALMDWLRSKAESVEAVTHGESDDN